MRSQTGGGVRHRPNTGDTHNIAYVTAGRGERAERERVLGRAIPPSRRMSHPKSC